MQKNTARTSNETSETRDNSSVFDFINKMDVDNIKIAGTSSRRVLPNSSQSFTSSYSVAAIKKPNEHQSNNHKATSTSSMNSSLKAVVDIRNNNFNSKSLF